VLLVNNQAILFIAIFVFSEEGRSDFKTKLSVLFLADLKRVTIAQTEAIGQPIILICRTRHRYPEIYFSRRKKENHGNKMASLFMSIVCKEGTAACHYLLHTVMHLMVKGLLDTLFNS
jgi:hypothetical protein